MKNILEIKDLKVDFSTFRGTAHVLDIENLFIKEGEIYGIAGESGSGKSILAQSILNLITLPGKIKEGQILFKGKDLLKLHQREMTRIRGEKIAMIFQDPMASLNPVLTVGQQMVITIRHHKKISAQEAEKEAKRRFEDVKLPDPDTTFKKYPHELSGGMRQRVLIALALSCGAELLIADEATRALDVTIQAGILDLLKDLRQKNGTTILLITNSLGVAAQMCDRVGILYTGSILEEAPVKDIFKNPAHPYTKALIDAVPTSSLKEQKLPNIGGFVPDPIELPSGCTFEPRCPHASEICRSSKPKIWEMSPGHFAACHLVEKSGDKIG